MDQEGSTAQLKGFISGNTGEARDKWELDTARMYGIGACGGVPGLRWVAAAAAHSQMVAV